MTIYGVMQVYNSGKTLKMSLSSIIDYVDNMVIVDGPWSDFPHRALKSTDDTYKIAKAICGDKLVWVPCPNKAWPGNTVGKCNEFMKHVPMGEWFVHLGSDETLAGKIADEFKRLEGQTRYVQANIPLTQVRRMFDVTPDKVTKKVYDSAPVKTVKTGKSSNRVFKKLPGMVWGPHRDTLYMKDVPMIKLYKSFELDRLVLVNHKYLQSWDQYMCGVIYRRTLIKENTDKYWKLLRKEGF